MQSFEWLPNSGTNFDLAATWNHTISNLGTEISRAPIWNQSCRTGPKSFFVFHPHALEHIQLFHILLFQTPLVLSDPVVRGVPVVTLQCTREFWVLLIMMSEFWQMAGLPGMIWLFGLPTKSSCWYWSQHQCWCGIWLAPILSDQVKCSPTSGLCKSQGVVDGLGTSRPQCPWEWLARFGHTDFIASRQLAGTSSSSIFVSQLLYLPATGRDVIEQCELQPNSEKTILSLQTICVGHHKVCHILNLNTMGIGKADNDLRLSKYAIIYLLVYESGGTALVRQRHEKMELLKTCAMPFFLCRPLSHC